jgi:hypothetical protein
LLIDEVDVFFSADFYGRTFNPIKLFVDEKNKFVCDILREVWKYRKLNMLELERHMLDFAGYKNLCGEYSDWKDLFKMHLLLMIHQV